LKKIIFTGIVSLFVSVALLVNSAQAAIMNNNDINKKITALKTLSQKDFYTMFNKSAIIGMKRERYELVTSQYKSNVEAALTQLKTIQKDAQYLQNTKMAKDEKNTKINTLYQNADTLLYNLDSKTSQYIEDIGEILPNITYSRFQKKFYDFYNNLNITK